VNLWVATGLSRHSVPEALSRVTSLSGLVRRYVFEADGSMAWEGDLAGRWRATGSRWLER
jgi:hypothetical protein